MSLYLSETNMSISTVTSEALQLKLRQLLPSQQGFGTDLSASDTIIPVIDLTAAAEGSDVRESLQRSLAFGSQTNFAVSNGNTTIANTAGFYQITGSVSIYSGNSLINTASIILNDSAADKIVWQSSVASTSVTLGYSYNINEMVFLRSGDSCIIKTSSLNARFTGSVRQIADLNGTLVQPVGFTPQ
ncbi:MAG: capsid protein [Circular genetic element sp.]|nr:MAG: capsid protein [Circular genetic element sp.]